MNEYNTDIDRLTCDCKDWEEVRKSYEYKDPRRLCKHIIRKLDINDLPSELKKFKDLLYFYQEKAKGFKTNFDRIIYLEDLTLLGLSDWIDVCDTNGIRYGVKKDDNHIRWANQNKPKNYKVVEEYLNENIHYPNPLSADEQTYILQKIKQLDKRFLNLKISVSMSRFSSLETERYYEINCNDYYLDRTSILVNNDYSLITVYSGEEYKINRDDSKLDKIRKQREIEEKKQQEMELIAKKKREEFEANYDTVTNLLKAESSRFSSVKFNQQLKELHLIYKNQLKNEKRWIIQDLGLYYGVNYDPQNIGESYPYWHIDRFSNLHAIVIYYNLIKDEKGYEEKVQDKIKESIKSFKKSEKKATSNTILKKLRSWLK